MSEDRPQMSEAELRRHVSALRAWEPATDESARETARAGLLLHISGDASVVAARRRRWPSPRRWFMPLIATAIIAGGGGALAAVLLRTQHTNRLAVFTAQGRLSPQFRVGARGSGYCWTASLATEAGDAYRCMQGNAIHDPCFAARADPRTVACFTDPWHAVTILRLTRRLPGHGPRVSGPVLPWAIVTTDGRRCVYLTGATAAIGGERINYGCTDGTYLIGDPDTSDPLWRIRSARRYVPDDRAPIGHFRLVAIAQTVG